MDPMGDPLTTRLIQTGWEFTMEPDPSRQFGFIHDPERQFGNGSVWTRTRTRSDSPEPLLTLYGTHYPSHLRFIDTINPVSDGSQASSDEHLDIPIEKSRKRVRRYDTTHCRGRAELRRSMKSVTEWVKPKVGEASVWIFIEWYNEMEMGWCLSTPASAESILCVTLSTFVTCHCLSVHQPAIFKDILAGRDRVY